ncbi:tail protein X [Marinomonas mediterranea]|uniref:tail protein X n=1 Tax=Marinomonas mediterranea TaxID=119864 RepID=UPI00234BBFD1|nr:tail protein X [Marinomonas mediterranea]
MKTIRSRDGDTISNILLLGLGRNDDEAEEALFEQNPGLEQHGPVLPAGVIILYCQPCQKKPLKRW